MEKAKGIKISRSVFDEEGGCFNFEVPKYCDLIILCGNKGGGYVPYRCLLPHQVYLKDIKEKFKESDFEAIFVLPVKSKNAFLIAGKDDYCINKWEVTN